MDLRLPLLAVLGTTYLVAGPNKCKHADGITDLVKRQQEERQEAVSRALSGIPVTK